MAKHKPWQGHARRAPRPVIQNTGPKVGMFQLPEIPADVTPANPAEHYQGTWLSPVWALLFGPFYYLAHGFWREFFLTLITVPFGIGLLIGPLLARGAWDRRAVDRADKKNLETLILLLVERDHG